MVGDVRVGGQCAIGLKLLFRSVERRLRQARPARTGKASAVHRSVDEREVTIKNDMGGQLGATPQHRHQTDVFARYGYQVDAEIAQIIRKNGGQRTLKRKTRDTSSRRANPTVGYAMQQSPAIGTRGVAQ
jgi:hypothetical protein